MKYTEDILESLPRPLCLVGNSDITSGLGSVIDQYPSVLRINNYIIKGYEDRVGTKTSVRCVNGQVNLENRRAPIEISPFHASSPQSMDLPEYILRSGREVTTPFTNILELIPEVTYPSTGFALIQLLHEIGIEVDMFGFGGLDTSHDVPEIDHIMKRSNVLFINELYPYQEVYDHCHSQHKAYDRNVGTRVFFQKINGKNILEFGAGNGDLSAQLEDMGNEVTAVEVSKEAFEKIRCSRKINGGVFSLVPLNKQYDMVISIDVLEHLTENDIRAFLRHSSRIAKECYLAISTRPSGLLGPNGENLHLTVKDLGWWKKTISNDYKVTSVNEGSFDYQFIFRGVSLKN